MLQTPTPTSDLLRDRFRWRPQERQAKLLAAGGVLDWFLKDGPITQPKAPLIGYGGAAGGGKTDALLALGLILCHAFKGMNVTFFRRKYTELEGPDGAIHRSQELFSNLGTYNQVNHRWQFHDAPGSSIYFRHCNNPKDRYNYQSQAFPLLEVDESTHFTWEIIDYLVTRNRATIPGYRPFAVMASNPGNIGHVWMSETFDVQDLSGGEEGAHERVKHRLTPNNKYEDVYFIPARLEDNKILMELDPDYERKLESRNPDLVEALRFGNWTVFAGQVFRTWRRERHVIPPRELPDHFIKWRAVDWGFFKPFCCLWLARDPDIGRIYVYRELYGTGITDKRQARMIFEQTAAEENIILTYADPAMWTRKTYQDTVYSTADEYAAEQVPLTRADNDRISGVRKVHRLLENLPDGKPGLLVMENCTNLIRTMPMLVADETHVEDVDTEQEDHPFDALKYGLTNYRLYHSGEKKDKDKKQKGMLDGFGSIL